MFSMLWRACYVGDGESDGKIDPQDVHVSGWKSGSQQSAICCRARENSGYRP